MHLMVRADGLHRNAYKINLEWQNIVGVRWGGGYSTVDPAPCSVSIINNDIFSLE